jgi:hypothetical protein
MSAEAKWQEEKAERLRAMAAATERGDMEEVAKIRESTERYELLVGKYGHEATAKGVEEAMWGAEYSTPEDAWAAAEAAAKAVLAPVAVEAPLSPPRFVAWSHRQPSRGAAQRAAATLVEAAAAAANEAGLAGLREWASPPRMPRIWDPPSDTDRLWLGAKGDRSVPMVKGAPSPRPLAAREEALALRVEELRHAARAAKENYEAAAAAWERAIILHDENAQQMALARVREAREAAAYAHVAFSEAQRAAADARPPHGRGGYRRSRRSRKNKRTRNTRRRILR